MGDQAAASRDHAFAIDVTVGLFNPVGVTADDDVAAFRQLRSVKRKLGWASMVATLGFMTPEFRVEVLHHEDAPVGVYFNDFHSNLAALSTASTLAWIQTLACIGFFKLLGGLMDFQMYGSKQVSTLSKSTPEPGAMMQLSRELADGRFAMIAVLALLPKNRSRSSSGEDGLRTHVLRLGALERAWDPAGFTADDDVEIFRFHRSIGRKMARTGMLANVETSTLQIQSDSVGLPSGLDDLKSDGGLDALQALFAAARLTSMKSCQD